VAALVLVILPHMSSGLSGDGFVTLADGTLRWGRFGAAGVLVRCPGDDGSRSYFLARRSEWCHQGGCWAIPGGALHHGETPVDGALREFVEEVGDVLGEFAVVDVHQDDHGGWSYWTVIIEVTEPFAAPTAFNWETAETGWIPHDRLGGLDLHSAFRQTLGQLGYLPEPPQPPS
jgi:8-oxo-dGTP diphosphatase